MLEIVGRSDPGARGGANQDAMGWDEARQIALVADGMGGYAGGEVASGLVKDTLLGPWDAPDLELAILRAHALIVADVAAHSERTGMGSTVVVVRVVEQTAHIGWVGDSRAYLWRRRRLQALTRDHSAVEFLRDVENLSETQVREHPLRHKILKSLGKDQPSPSSVQIPLEDGDLLLLCSDGLSGELLDSEIAEVLSRRLALAEAAEALIAAALAKAGRDNVTVVLVQYTAVRNAGGWRRFWLIAGAALLFAVGILWWWLKS
jgi:protein phosphatase